MLDGSEFSRWISMVKKTIDSSRGDLERGDYNWACFKAQQSAEFAVKALLHGLGLEAYGHSISSLLLKLPRELKPLNYYTGS
ncbi:MAG: HEPN domain-containing protein [Nitrososphaerota archaeon]